MHSSLWAKFEDRSDTNIDTKRVLHLGPEWYRSGRKYKNRLDSNIHAKRVLYFRPEWYQLWSEL